MPGRAQPLAIPASGLGQPRQIVAAYQLGDAIPCAAGAGSQSAASRRHRCRVRRCILLKLGELPCRGHSPRSVLLDTLVLQHTRIAALAQPPTRKLSSGICHASAVGATACLASHGGKPLRWPDHRRPCPPLRACTCPPQIPLRIRRIHTAIPAPSRTWLRIAVSPLGPSMRRNPATFEFPHAQS